MDEGAIMAPLLLSAQLLHPFTWEQVCVLCRADPASWLRVRECHPGLANQKPLLLPLPRKQ